MPKISIVTPAYNCEKYLEEAGNSVLAQSFEDWELLIIDDCSKDATWLRMQTLAKQDNRIRIFQNRHNSGSAATRNNGIRQARGEWIAFLDSVLASLEGQTLSNFEVILVDNGSTDGSCSFVTANYPWVHLIELSENFGFCGAVNAGIRAAKAPYVLLLNNDTEVKEDFVEEMLAAIRRHKNAFSCGARMVQYHDRDRLDDVGNYYCALGWSFARGRGKDIHAYETEDKIFSACAGAAIYRKKIIEKIGYFDEEHFAYLEDTDIGYRARIYGYENWYAPKAIVYHVGSGTSGSRYNQFKTRYSSRNNIYLIYKNMPLLQIILNLPFLAVGFLIKFLFFAVKGMGKEYAAGIKNGFSISMKNKKVPFRIKHLPNYCKIQLELWINIIRRFRA